MVPVNNKAYMFTILGYLLVTSVFGLAFLYSSISRDQHAKTNVLRGSEKVFAITKGIESDLQEILDLSATSAETTITIYDHMTADYNIQNLLSEYVAQLSSYEPVNISFSPGGPNFRINPQNMTYEYDTFVKNQIRIYDDVPPQSYSVILSVLGNVVVASTSPSRVSGSFPLFVQFKKGEDVLWTAESGTVDINSCNTYQIDFQGGKFIKVSCGNCYGYQNSLIIQTSGTKTDIKTQINATNSSLIYLSRLSVQDVTGAKIARYPILSVS